MAVDVAYRDEQRGLELRIEDDGVAAWAYLKDMSSPPRVLSGVWLYNNRDSDTRLPDSEGDLVPLPRNPARFAADDDFSPISRESDIIVNFGGGAMLEAYVEISIRSEFHAYMEARARLGWCVLAKTSGPYAKKMVLTPLPDGRDVHLCDYEAEG